MPIFGGGRKGIGIGNSNISDAGIVGGGNSSGNSSDNVVVGSMAMLIIMKVMEKWFDDHGDDR